MKILNPLQLAVRVSLLAIISLEKAMKRVSLAIIYLFSLTGWMSFSINTVHADENPFTQNDVVSSSEKSKNFSRGMCGMGRCGGCGGGMMWGGKGKPKIGDITELPESKSQGAKLVNRYCTQCHALPNPRLHSTEGWLVTLERMNARMQWMSQNGNEILAPSKNELEALTAYMRKHSL
jgi:hypothetical protein